MRFQTYTTLNDQDKWERTLARARRLPFGGLLCILLYLLNGFAIGGMIISPSVVVGTVTYNFLPQPFPILSWQALVVGIFMLIMLAFATGMFFEAVRYWKRGVVAIDAAAFGIGSLLAVAVLMLFAGGYLQP